MELQIEEHISTQRPPHLHRRRPTRNEQLEPHLEYANGGRQLASHASASSRLEVERKDEAVPGQVIVV